MKKLFLLLCLAVTTTVFIACEGEQGPPGNPGDPGVTILSETFTVSASDWQLDASNGSYFYQKTPKFFNGLSEDDRYDIFDYGWLMITRIFDDGTYVSQQPLPYIDNWNNGTQTQVDNFWYDYTPFDIRIYYKYSGNEEPALPSKAEFRVVVNW